MVFSKSSLCSVESLVAANRRRLTGSHPVCGYLKSNSGYRYRISRKPLGWHLDPFGFGVKMPTLYVFAVCEKVIIDKNEVPSLISLFNTMTVGVVPGQVRKEIPLNAVVPKEWFVFSSWDWEADDDGKTYKQHIEVLLPDRSVFVKVDHDFAIPPRRKIQTSVPIAGFPIGQQGLCTVRTWLEHEGKTIVEPRPILLEVKHPT